ncbi:ribonuclease Y [Candidatus Mcinerneyibacteriota bacterium]|nr:ribonuclease Y [Candidatus Mcinerneyibacteriota bacterium]
MENTLLIVVFVSVGVLLGFFLRIFIGKLNKKSAEMQAAHILNDAHKEAESIKREGQLLAKSELYEMRNKFEQEKDEKNRTLQKFEQRLLQKEENLDKRILTLEKRERELVETERKVDDKEKELRERVREVEAMKQREMEELSAIASLTEEEAREIFLEKVARDSREEAEHLAKRVKEEILEKADEEATKIIVEAIQRTAVDTVTDHTVSVVALPSDEMKGRIIGREGRNIRTLQRVTGVDIIIDDTPEAVTLSCFDPIRREIARQSLEKLVVDGRIHPGRIEDIVQKSRKEVDKKIREEGEKTIIDLNIPHVHKEVVKLLGRLQYRTSYGQNVLNHSKEVAIVMGVMAGELGLNVALAKRIGLLHDIGKAVDFEMEGTHAQIGSDLAKKYGEKPVVVNAIGAHHGEIEQESVFAVLLMAADAISAARPGARRESIESYIKRLEKLEGIAQGFKGVEKAYAIQAGREIRIIISPDDVDDMNASKMAREIAQKIEGELDYPGMIKVNVIREKRYIEYAK